MPRYRWTRLDTIMVLAIALLIVPGIIRLVRSRPPAMAEDPRGAAAPAPSPVEAVDPAPEMPGAVTLDTVPETWAPAPAWERESDRWLLMRQQTDAMRHYAETAEPDDPFALSEEEILAFEEAGDPVLW